MKIADNNKSNCEKENILLRRAIYIIETYFDFVFDKKLNYLNIV
jgi:hypothetical protein